MDSGLRRNDHVGRRRKRGQARGIKNMKNSSPLGLARREIMLDIQHSLVYPPAVIAAGIVMDSPQCNRLFSLKKEKASAKSLLCIDAEAGLRKGDFADVSPAVGGVITETVGDTADRS